MRTNILGKILHMITRTATIQDGDEVSRQRTGERNKSRKLDNEANDLYVFSLPPFLQVDGGGFA